MLEFLGMVEQFSRPEERYIDERRIRFLDKHPYKPAQFHVRHLMWLMLATGVLSGTGKVIANEIERDEAANYRITAKDSGSGISALRP